MVIPLFKSHYSIGRSILTLAKEGSSVPDGPDSIIDICKENKIDNFYLVDDSMGGFLEAYTNSKESGLSFSFGLRIKVCHDLEEKNEASLSQECSYIIFANNTSGYKRLIKIYTDAAKKGFYYVPRIDFKTLKKYWSNEDLSLVVPFYDSFLHKNHLHGSTCLPDFDFTVPTFFIEKSDMFLDLILEERAIQFCKSNNFESQNVRSIYYKNKSDFIPYLSFRCINKRADLNKPQLDHMSSNEFCFESWKEQNETA